MLYERRGQSTITCKGTNSSDYSGMQGYVGLVINFLRPEC